MNTNLKKDFEEQFGAKVEPGTRRFVRKVPLSLTNIYEYDSKFTVEDVPTLTIHITEEEFENMTRYIPGRLLREKHIREDIPAVKKAWDNYQLLLKMCGGDYI